MEKIQKFRLIKRIFTLVLLICCLGVVTSTDLTPRAAAAPVCCYCDQILTACYNECAPEDQACRYACDCQYPIVWCFAHCIADDGQYCESNDDCPLGANCVGSTCRCP